MGNVVELKDYSVAEDINDWIDGLEAINTKKRYFDNVSKFIKWKWNKPVEFLTPENIDKLTYTDLKKYRDAMRIKYSVGTVNNMLTSIYMLLKELKKVQDENTEEYIYDIEDLDRLKVKQFKNNNVESAGYLEWCQTDDWILFLEDNRDNINNVNKKIAFIKLARLTGLRVTALANLKYSDVRKEDDIYVIHSYLKGSKHKISIPDDIANMIFDLKRIGDTKDSQILFSSKTAERLIDSLKDEFQIEEEKNISLHSLRNLAAWETYCYTKDILAVQKILNHKSISTSYDYIKKRESTELSPTLCIGKEMDSSTVEDIKKEQWIEIFDKMPRFVQYEIINKAKELGYSHDK